MSYRRGIGPRQGGFVLAIVVLIAAGCGGDHDRSGIPPQPGVPRITLVSPDQGTMRGGDMVTVETIDFQDDFTLNLPLVYFGTAQATNVTASDCRTLTVVTPLGPTTGPVDVEVYYNTTHLAVLVGGFTYTGEVAIFGQTIPAPSDSLIYVLNRSGSMSYSGGTWIDRFGNQVSGTRWDRVKDAVLYSIGGLPENVRFNIVTFSCALSSFLPASDFATPANKVAAETWMGMQFPYGGSGTGPAVAEALQEKPNLTVLLVGDGSPNCGASGLSSHLNMILNENTQGAAVHTFGVGATGIYRQFLEDVAAQTGGTYTHILP